jgi:hypothetical protein
MAHILVTNSWYWTLVASQANQKGFQMVVQACKWVLDLAPLGDQRESLLQAGTIAYAGVQALF